MADFYHAKPIPGGRTAYIRALEIEIEKRGQALREIGTPAHVPRGFDPAEWWQHRASKQGEIAREALGVTVEELILMKEGEGGDR